MLINPVPASDVDIWVYEDTSLVLVVEVQNWSRRSHPEDLDANNVRKIFEKYDAEKLLVTSLHFEVFDDLRKDDVAILELGFNILPRGWYEFYKSKGETEKFGMNYFNSETEGTIKTKLSEYLLEEDL